MRTNKIRPTSALGLRERRRDTAVSPHFIDLAGIGGLFPGGPLPHTQEPLISCRGIPARSNQKWPGVRLIRGGVLRSFRSAREASALFAVGELVQDIQEKVASEDAKREKYCG